MTRPAAQKAKAKAVTGTNDNNKPNPVSIADGLENVVTGLGTSADKSTYNRWYYSGSNQDWPQLVDRFREDWVSKKVCEIIPQDMCRVTCPQD